MRLRAACYRLGAVGPRDMPLTAFSKGDSDAGPARPVRRRSVSCRRVRVWWLGRIQEARGVAMRADDTRVRVVCPDGAPITVGIYDPPLRGPPSTSSGAALNGDAMRSHATHNCSSHPYLVVERAGMVLAEALSGVRGCLMCLGPIQPQLLHRLCPHQERVPCRSSSVGAFMGDGLCAGGDVSW